MVETAELLAQLMQEDRGIARAHTAASDLREMTWRLGRPGAEKRAAQLAAALAAPLKERRSPFVTRELCDMLSLIAGDEQVPILAPMLEDKETRDPALFVLDRINGEAATKALLAAATGSYDPEFRVSVINKLSRRGDAAKPTLLKLLDDERAEIRLAAVDALANFADPNLDEKFQKAAAQGNERDLKRVANARLCLASRLAEAGNKEAANKIFKSVAESDAAGPQKEAAQRALKA